MSGAASLCAFDWGTSSLRGYLLDRTGTVLTSCSGDEGILTVADGGFEQVLHAKLAELQCLDKDLPIIASGMITSRQGWQETPYVDCPAGLEELAGGLVQRNLTDGRRIHFVPGVSHKDPFGVPDVMRGEETQLQAIAERDRHCLAVLPGTHSKWAIIEPGGRISWFATFMTGELFAVLSQHSILGRLMTQGQPHDSAFERGVDMALSSPHGLLGRLFSARTLALFDQLGEAEVADYLSGLLIGGEIVEARHAVSGRLDQQSLVLIGDPRLVARYQRALRLAGLDSSVADSTAAAQGLLRIAETAGLLR